MFRGEGLGSEKRDAMFKARTLNVFPCLSATNARSMPSLLGREVDMIDVCLYVPDGRSSWRYIEGKYY